MAKGKYSEWLTSDGLLLIKSWARDGLSDEKIADKIGVSRSTFYNWIKSYPDILDTIKKGRKPVIVEVEDTFFEKKLKGYYVDEEIREKTVSRDDTGAITGTTEHVRTSKRYIAPDTTALIFYLKCRKGNIYNDKPDIADTSALDRLDEILKEMKENADTQPKTE